RDFLRRYSGGGRADARSASNQHPASFKRQDCTLVAWYRYVYAPRAGGAYDSHHRTAGILEVFSRHGNSHGPGAGTPTSAGPPPWGRVSGPHHEPVPSAAIATLAGFRFRRWPLPLRPPPQPVPPKTPRRKTTMKTRAAVALEKGKPLTVTEVELDGPKASEVLVEVKATGICHTDEFTLSGADPEGLFPAILGHEGAGIVVDVGPGVTSVKKGDHVIPLY